MGRLLQPKKKRIRTSVGLPEELWEELEQTAKTVDYTRDEVIEELLRWGLAQWKLQRQSEKERK
jgi:metal-responsive CopG/Arc/MetJ family transcriptional regulator